MGLVGVPAGEGQLAVDWLERPLHADKEGKAGDVQRQLVMFGLWVGSYEIHEKKEHPVMARQAAKSDHCRGECQGCVREMWLRRVRPCPKRLERTLAAEKWAGMRPVGVWRSQMAYGKVVSQKMASAHRPSHGL